MGVVTIFASHLGLESYPALAIMAILQLDQPVKRSTIAPQITEGAVNFAHIPVLELALALVISVIYPSEWLVMP